MPRHARLDASGTLHHVILRGLERGAIVRDDQDRAAFVTRLGTVAQAARHLGVATAAISKILRKQEREGS
jgi:hypothetical protein